MNPKIKISQLPAKGSNLAAADLLEVAEFTGTGYISKSITGQEIIDAASSGVVTSVTGTAPIASSGGTTPAISIATANTSTAGALSSTDWNTFNGKQAALVSGTNIKTVNSTSLLGSGDVAVQATLVSGTNIKTINGTSVLGSGDIAIASGITIGTTAIASGTVGRVLFEGTGNVVQESAGLTYNDTTKAFSVIGNQNATTNISVLNTDTTNASSRARVSVTSGTIIGSLQSIIGNDFYIGTESAHNVNFTTAGATKFNINNTSGNVTVGALASDIGARLGTKGVGNTSATKAFLAQNSSSTDLFTIWNDGAIGINTATNAGYKLDVNGTARVSGSFTQSGSSLISTISGFWYVQNTGNVTTFGSYESQQGMTYRSGQPFCINVANGSHATSATVQIDSTTKGFLPPRMTTTQKNAIASPAAGLMVYDTTLNVISYYNGTSWI